MKVQHQPYSFEDGPVVYPANAFDSRPQGDQVPLGSSPTKPQRKTFRVGGFLFHSLLRLSSFLSQYKNDESWWCVHVDVREVRDNCGFAYTGRGQIMNLWQISGHDVTFTIYFHQWTTRAFYFASH